MVSAGDFDWIKDFNIRAEADATGFRARLETRFKIGNAEIETVIGNVEDPASAYIVCRLVEMSKQPAHMVIERYKRGKSKGWGSIAKSLGIKPGSKEFHALKRGNDLYSGNSKATHKGKGKGKKRS